MINVAERKSVLVMQSDQLKKELGDLDTQDRWQPKPRISHREVQILSYVADGNSNKQIAHILGTSIHTIKNHVGSILYKIDANDRAHAVALAMQKGLIN